ncbi:MAG: Alanyl-tRNA synthetase [Ktedonobacterales bacterium]|jgi:alanyl-tRNA synthetase|nr:MAG: Alanyl-tRNA synthetase [Ktedonobacterales bacterium]
MTTENKRKIWTAPEIVETYLAFFRERGHLEIPGSPLVVPDGTTLFVVAGMQPLMPYLRGQVAPPAPRLTDLQRCLRTDDIDAVGTNGRKLTSFHMLGNWSIGDYTRREAIALALDLLDCFGVERSSLWVTTFAGEPSLGLARDEVAVEEWRRVGMPESRIVPLEMDDNFWSTGGPGPCGPDSEIFVDRGEAVGCGKPECRPGCSCERFLEIWNLVFSEFEQRPDGGYEPLPIRSVDTGMGLERVAAVMQGVLSVYETDLFAPALRRLRELAPSGISDGASETRAVRMILDHTRTALLAGLAGVTPGRDGRGSVVRRLIRRAARQGYVLGLRQPFLGELVAPLVAGHGTLLTPRERERALEIARTLGDEERRFARVLATGLREVERIRPDDDGTVAGERLFVLHAERGFPADLAAEVLAERGITVRWPEYERAFAEHRAISRVGTGAQSQTA